MSQDPAIEIFEGIGVRARGDLVTVVYGNDARLERTRWLFDRLDAAAKPNAEGIIVHLIVLSDSGPPDGPTRDENTRRIRKLGPGMRRLVTTPLGDGLQVSVVRTIMRGLAIITGQSNQFVANTVQQGITRCRDGASRETPNADAMKADFTAIMTKLGRPVAA